MSIAAPILERWEAESALGDRVAAIPANEAQAAGAFFDELAALSPDDTRSRLADGDRTRNAQLAWLLLAEVPRAYEATPAQAAPLVAWSEFVAQYGEQPDADEDLLRGHGRFWDGAVQHAAGALTDAYQAYAQAEQAYRDAGATVLLALAVYAQGAVAHEVADAEGERLLFSRGSDERFATALDLVRDRDASAFALIGAQVERAAAQSALVADLLAADAPDGLLDAKAELLDAALVSVLRSNMLRSTDDAAAALRAARVGDAVVARLGTEEQLRAELAGVYIRDNRLDAAERVLEDALADRPDDLALLRQLVVVKVRAGRPDAEALLDRLLGEHPDDAELVALAGLTLLTKEPERARERFERALELDPGDQLAQWGLAQLPARAPAPLVAFKDGNLVVSEELLQLPQEEAAAEMTAAILSATADDLQAELDELAQSDPALAGRVAAILRAQGRLAPQRTPAEDALARGEELFGAGRFEEALPEYRAAIAADPQLAWAYVGLGDSYYRLGKFFLAAAWFEESTEIEPTPQAWYFLGNAQVRVGRRAEAASAYRSALELSPGYGLAQAALQQLEAAT